MKKPLTTKSIIIQTIFGTILDHRSYITMACIKQTIKGKTTNITNL